MEGNVVDPGHRAGRSQQLNHDPPPGTSYPDLHNEFLSAVIGAMDSSADLPAQNPQQPELSQKLLGELVPSIYKGLRESKLKATA